MAHVVAIAPNKAVYTATTVAGGWTGAVMNWAGAQKAVCILKVKRDGRTDQPTDRRTDRPTDRPTQWVIGRVTRDKNYVTGSALFPPIIRCVVYSDSVKNFEKN